MSGVEPHLHSRGRLAGVLRRAMLVGAALLLPCVPQALAAPVTTSFTVTGAVDKPGTYTQADLLRFPQQTEAVTYTSGNQQVSASFTGPTLWSVLSDAVLTPVPGARNSTLRDVVVATGSDGYKVAFSGGELNPSFGGSLTDPRTGLGRNQELVAYARDGLPLGTDGFARIVVPGDKAGGRYVSNLIDVNVVQAPNNPFPGGGQSTSFTLSGLVRNPGVYDAAALQARRAMTETVTYLSGNRPVTATFTGVSLWDLLVSAGLILDPTVKNDELHLYVLATGSDGYEATFSLGELDPRFGGSQPQDLIAYDVDGGPLGANGFARLVVPGDAAGGRYVSNLVSLQVLDAAAVTAVPEPASLVLLAPALAGVWVLRRRRVRGVSSAPSSPHLAGTG